MAYDCKTPEDVLKVIKDDKIEMIDLRFTDFLVCGNTFRCRHGPSMRTASATE